MTAFRNAAGGTPRETPEGWPVDLRIRFERFPATIRGAFVMQGADGYPHKVEMESATIDRVPTGASEPVPVEHFAVNVAPGRDLFVPFEVPVIDLEPGWYAVRCSVVVDGARSYGYSSRALPVAFLAPDVRQGTFRIHRDVGIGDLKYRIERVELGTEGAVVVWRAVGDAADPTRDEGPPPQITLVVDGRRVDSLSPELAPLPRSAPVGERRTVTYPVPHSARSLVLEMRSAGAELADRIEVPLG